MKILTERGYTVTAIAEREMVPDVKEILCYMRLEFDTEHKLTAPIDNEKTYELPDGNISTVDAERFLRVEVLFQPKFHW